MSVMLRRHVSFISCSVAFTSRHHHHHRHHSIAADIASPTAKRMNRAPRHHEMQPNSELKYQPSGSDGRFYIEQLYVAALSALEWTIGDCNVLFST